MNEYYYLIEHKPYDHEGWAKALGLLIRKNGEDKFAKFSYKRKVKELELMYLSLLLVDIAKAQGINQEEKSDTTSQEETS